MTVSRLRPKVNRKTILVVEDEICCAMSLQLMLESYGCKVFLANACEEALVLLRVHHKYIDLILLDIMMPDKTGIDFLIEARKEDILSGIPVVIQSAEGNETIQQALNNGACGYVHKPHIKAEISNLVTNLAKHKIFSHSNVERVSA